MTKLKAAIIGSGNIGTDLMIKILPHGQNQEIAAMVGIDPASDGLARAKRMGVATTAEGVEGLVKMAVFKGHRHRLRCDQRRRPREERCVAAQTQARHTPDRPDAGGNRPVLHSELEIPWRLCRGLAVIGRAIGIVGHLAEELRNPIAMEVLLRTEEESSSHLR